MGEKLELYVYTTKSYEAMGYLKVGHCKRGRHLERINEQFGTSNAEPPKILWVKDLPEGKIDYHIHHKLIAMGIKKVDGVLLALIKSVRCGLINTLIYQDQITDSLPDRKNLLFAGHLRLL